MGGRGVPESQQGSKVQTQSLRMLTDTHSVSEEMQFIALLFLQ